MVNQMYDAVMTLEQGYKRWCNAMRELTENYMSPLMDRIANSQDIMEQIEQEENAIRAAAELDQLAPGMQPLDDRTIQALNLSARRREAHLARVRSRCRRQRTI